MLKDFKDGLAKALCDEQVNGGIVRKMVELGLDTHLPTDICSMALGEKKKKPSEDVAKQIPGIFDEAIKEVRRYDEFIEALQYWRNSALEAAIAARYVYEPEKNEIVKKLADVNTDTEDGQVRARNLLSLLIGEEVVRTLVNISTEINGDMDRLMVSFGVKDIPTMGLLEIPVEVNYQDRYDVYKHFDRGFDGIESDRRTHIGVEFVEKRRPHIELRIASGMTNRYEYVSQPKNFEEAGKDILKLGEIDARKSLKDFGGIENVKTAKEFAEWRGRRFADKHARMNGVN